MALRLELFDAPEPVEETSGPSADFAAGYAEGHLAGLAEAAARQDRLTEDIAANLSDLGFGYAEARRHILQSLSPLFDQLAQRIVPSALAANLGTEVARLLNETAAADAANPIQIFAATDTIPFLTQIFDRSLHVPWQLQADPTLTERQIRWATGQTESVLDHELVMQRIRTALGAILEDFERNMDHG